MLTLQQLQPAAGFHINGYLNGVAIGGATSSIYNIPSASLTDTGSYQVVVSGTCGTDTSNISTLQLTTTLTFSQQPQAQTACAGSPVTFSVIANGTNPTYQWLFDGNPIGGATASSYTIGSVGLGDAGHYACLVTSDCGNGSSDTVSLTVNSPTSYSYSASICSGTTYDFNGQTLSTGGTYTSTVTGSNGCDSVVTLTLSVTSSTGSTINAAICVGGSYDFNGQTLTTQGTYYDTLSGSGGCDSIVTLNLAVNQATASTISAGICPGGVYNFNGSLLTSGGTYLDTITGSGGCDSIITLNLSINPPINVNLSQSICAGSSYDFNGQTLTTGGTYIDTLTAGSGCDSIVTLNLTVIQPVSQVISAAICAGSSYTFGSQTLTTAGTYIDTLTSSSGCDSIVTLVLTVNQPSTQSVNQTICQGSSYDFNGQMLTVGGTYIDTLITGGGCDSIVTLFLSVTPILYDSINASICTGSTYPFNGNNLGTAGIYFDTLTALSGCDSIVVLNLTVIEPAFSTLSATICAGSTYNFNGVIVSASGNYEDTIIGGSFTGCDSIIILQLTVNPPLTSTTNASICQGSSYNFNGTNLTAAGTYTDSLVTSGGCDSIATLVLSVETLPAVSFTFPDSFCSNGSSVVLTGGSPAGGTYSGTGVSAGSFNPAVAGVGSWVITYSYTDTSGCGGSDSLTFIVHTCLGINEVEMENAISLYPNPVSDLVTAQSSLFTNHKMNPVVYNVTGQVIEVGYTLEADKITFNTTHLPAGMYLIEFNIEGTTVNKHFVKMN